MSGRLTGEYKYQMDNKGRLRLPPSMLRLLGNPDELMIGIGSGEFLNVYTESYMDQLFDRFSNVDVTDYEKQDTIRELFSKMRPLGHDSQGRFQIPVELREEVGLGPNVVILGVVDRMEIWDADKYAQRNLYKSTRRIDVKG